ELAPDRGLRRRRFLEDRRRRLALGVVAEAPAVGQCASGLEAMQRERGRELAFKRHREQVGHIATLAESRAARHGAARRELGAAGETQRGARSTAAPSRLCSQRALLYAAHAMSEAPIAAADSAGDSTRGALDVRQVIDERPLGGFQRMIIVLCGLIVLLDGFDAQVMGYLAPALGPALHITRLDI